MNSQASKSIYFVSKFTIKILLNLFYRIRSENLEIPSGRIVVVSNHVSFIDAIMLIANTKRKMRFVIYAPIYNNWLLNPFFRSSGCIPITSAFENKEVLDRAYDSIANALEDDCAVVIYPEGKITTNGDLSEFKNGIEKIIERTPSDVYPTAINGLYGSYFSKSRNRKWYGKIFSKIRLIGGEVVKSEDVSSAHLKAVVAKLLER